MHQLQRRMGFPSASENQCPTWRAAGASSLGGSATNVKMWKHESEHTLRDQPLEVSSRNETLVFACACHMSWLNRPLHTILNREASATYGQKLMPLMYALLSGAQFTITVYNHQHKALLESIGHMLDGPTEEEAQWPHGRLKTPRHPLL